MHSRPPFSLVIGRRKLRLGERTVIMGIVNVTPDSFSDGGLYFDPERAIARGLELASQGADWIDVGGESTRPGAEPVTAQEELRRVLPVIEGLRGRLDARDRGAQARHGVEISIDTTKSEVAEAAARAGATILNDVSGLRFDPTLAVVARRHRLPMILMHLRGRPRTMQSGPFARSIWRSLGVGLSASIRTAIRAGVRRAQLLVDPGLGFGKTRRQNFEILAKFARLHAFHLPVAAGASRKSFVRAIVAGEPLTTSGPAAALAVDERKLAAGDAAAVVAAILGGAHVVRVHDVAALLPAVRMADAILSTIS